MQRQEEASLVPGPPLTLTPLPAASDTPKACGLSASAPAQGASASGGDGGGGGALSAPAATHTPLALPHQVSLLLHQQPPRPAGVQLLARWSA